MVVSRDVEVERN